jgi:ribonuclease HI
MKYSITFDGGAQPNPGPASYAYVIKENNKILYKGYEKFGIDTNNVAEYRGLIEALKKCFELKIDDLDIKGDSKLVVMQSQGLWKVKAENLKKYNSEARELIKKFKSIKISWVPREQNSEADELTDIAINNV